jgi:uncharacterized protein YqgV (UPF0045/DUF77 family)
MRMPDVTAQVSLYPLRQEHLGPAITAAITRFHAAGLDVWEGPMSTVIAGELDTVCTALRDASVAATTAGEAVLVITLSNGCPVPSRTVESREVDSSRA